MRSIMPRTIQCRSTTDATCVRHAIATLHRRERSSHDRIHDSARQIFLPDRSRFCQPKLDRQTSMRGRAIWGGINEQTKLMVRCRTPSTRVRAECGTCGRAACPNTDQDRVWHGAHRRSRRGGKTGTCDLPALGRGSEARAAVCSGARWNSSITTISPTRRRFRRSTRSCSMSTRSISSCLAMAPCRPRPPCRRSCNVRKSSCPCLRWQRTTSSITTGIFSFSLMDRTRKSNSPRAISSLPQRSTQSHKPWRLWAPTLSSQCWHWRGARERQETRHSHRV